MKTYLDCIPCFLKQALEAGKMAGADEKLQKEIIDNVCALIPQFPLNSTPPEMALKIHRLIKRLTSNNDPYLKIKRESQKKALAMYPYLKEKVKKGKDSLSIALKIATIGNIIDFAINDAETVGNGLESIDQQEFGIFAYEKFKAALHTAKKILYLGDNAGETVFDRVLIEEIFPGRKIYYGVRGAPIINDALEEDAKEAGIGNYAEIISNGSDAPGTLLNFCSGEFRNVFFDADMIISKGQGNFESLSNKGYPVFFLFKVKCLPVAKQIHGKIGHLVLMAERN